MLSKNQIKFIRSLRQKKFRLQNHQFVAEGHKSVSELLRSTLQIVQIYATEEWLNDRQSEISNLGAPKVTLVRQKELDRASLLVTAPEVLALVETPKHVLEKNELKGRFSLALDGVRDPGNLGTIIRLCDWFGWTDIVCSADCVDWTNPKVVQATMGSFARVRVHYLDELEDFLQSAEIPVFGARMSGEDFRNLSVPKEGFLLMGSESHGIRFEADNETSISIPGSGQTESLNVGVACGILMSALFQ